MEIVQLTTRVDSKIKIDTPDLPITRLIQRNMKSQHLLKLGKK